MTTILCHLTLALLSLASLEAIHGAAHGASHSSLIHTLPSHSA